MKSIVLFVLMAFAAVSASIAQSSQAAHVNIYLEGTDTAKLGSTINLVLELTPKAGWHVYSAIASEDGAYKPSEIGWEIESRGFEAVGSLSEKGKLIEKMDEIMGGMTRYYKDVVVFKVPVKVTEGDLKLAGYFDYMACNEYQCMPFTADFSIHAKLKD